ncbi:MAG TPA: PIG-L family deacetylase [Candidatus Angelobacter sp.]
MHKLSDARQWTGGLHTLRPLRSPNEREFPSEVIVVSPHCDDAAFSLAATLKLLVSAGSTVRIVNCFTFSRFAPFAGPQRNLTAMTRRRHEEEVFLHHLGGNSRSDDLGFLDAPARSGGGLRGILARNLSPQEAAELIRVLGETLEDLADDAAVLAPLALGNHSDHYLARQAALARYHGRPIAFYEDLPYAAAASEGQIETTVRQTEELCGGELQPLLVHWPGDTEWKRQCCSVYKSQVSAAGVKKIVDYMSKNKGERLWCSARFVEDWKWRSTHGLSAECQEPYFV